MLLRGFLGQCPHGELDKQKLFDMYCLLLPPGIAKIFVDQLFNIFDEDKSGSIDFKVRIQQCSDLSGLITFLSGVSHSLEYANIRECEGEIEMGI